MNNQRSLAPIIIVLIILVFLTGGIFAWKYVSNTKEETRLPEEKLPSLSNTTECNKSSSQIEQIITGPFRSIDDFTSAGEATLSGHVVTRNKKYFEEEVEKVYLEITPQTENTPQANFYSYFIHLVEEGNAVNARDNNNLLFSLGELKDNGKVLSSTANISSLAEAKILSAIKTGEAISLRLQVPIWVAMGAPSNFSFACAIEFSEN